MIDLADVLKEATASLEAALPNLTWERAASEALLTHYTGRGPEWRVELVVLGHGHGPAERMATGVRGTVVLKLTEEQAQRAEALARRPILEAVGDRE